MKQYFFSQSQNQSGAPAKKETDPQGIMSPFQAVSHLIYSFTQLQ